MADPVTVKDWRMQIVEEHLRAENAHDMNAIMATFGEKPSFMVNGASLQGHDAIRGFYEGFGWGNSGAFSDGKVDVRQRHITDDSVIMEVVVTGQHTGDWQAIPATQRHVEVPICAIVTFDANGKMAGERLYFDSALLLKQMGVFG